MLAFCALVILPFLLVITAAEMPQPRMHLLSTWNSSSPLPKAASSADAPTGSFKDLSISSDQNQTLSGGSIDENELNFIDNQDLEMNTAKTPLTDYLIKWGLFGVMVLTPLILIPILFLFIRGSANRSHDASNHED